jgi:DedD protein
MDSALKQRLIGAAVLVALAVIFLPMLLKGPGPAEPDAAQIPLDAPAAPDAQFETRELPLVTPSAVPEGGVTGLGSRPPADPADPNAVVTIDQTDAAAPRVDALPENDAALAAIDPATGQPAVADPTVGAPSGANALPTDPATSVEPVAAEAAPTGAATTPLPVATAGGKYAVNVGSFSNLDNARALADRLRAQGLALTSESVDVGGKPAMRLRVGPYAERTLAEAARLRVEAVTGGSATVIALDGSAVAPVGAPSGANAAPRAGAIAAEAAPTASTPARTGAAPTVGFAVQLGALSSETDANALRDRAKAAGFVAFAQRITTDRGVVWRVRVGPEADRAAADRLRDDVIAKLGTRDAIVVSHP